MKIRNMLFVGLALSLTANNFALAEELVACPIGVDALQILNNGELSHYPNFTEGPGMRVQKQHPQTFLYGQAKLAETERGTKFGLCTYSNHVGWVAIFGVNNVQTVNTKRDCSSFDCMPKSRWRDEFIESSPQNDPPGSAMMKVCVHNKGGVDYPSVGCEFKKSVNP